MNQDLPIDEIIGRISKLASGLGISRNELKVYFLLLMKGKMTAKELSDNLGVSYTKIYPVLSKLESRGWVKRVGKKPAMFAANSLVDVWSTVKKNILESVEKIEKDVITPLSLLFSSQPSLYNIILLPPESLQNTLQQILKEQSTIFYLAISFEELLNDEILKLLEANAYKSDVKLILTRPREIPPVINFKVNESMFGSGVVTNRSIMLIIKSSEGVLFGLYSTHVYFVEIGKVYFNYLWERSSKQGNNA
ncbi:TrmB family transcriptional regulator [Stygiolobus caldivivus]|uniref:Transcriptional regulator n=1 Tax=Stygiolobus caldivivus TaxID=2824673 RepID=A0A8D5U8I7_9CREN|nr:helix-turn-helix domain-containing protein [Stygiolobus caldivivus]BCU70704.1 transcriptional regulator [Stygiolobus caldivivus]